MKKAIYTLLLSLSFLTLFTTCKNPGIDYNTFSITKETILPDKHSVSVSGEYDFLGEVTGMKLNIDRDDQLVDAESYPMNLENQSFSVTVEGLDPGTLYYYCLVVEFDNNHKLLTDIDNFTTLSDCPKVRTLEVTAVDSTTVCVKCIVDDDYGAAITERGICWNLTGTPTLSDNHVTHHQSCEGPYSCNISGLEYNKTYYVCAYARNANGVGYGEVLGFHTEEPASLPSVTTAAVKNITATTATGGGTVVSEGSSHVTERGICWSTEHEPTLNNHHERDNGNGLGSFTVEMTNLTQDETYYVRAYAINEHGATVFGEEVNFVAKDGHPIVNIEEVTEGATGTAVCKCTIDDEGSSPIEECGICWGTGHNPYISDSHNNAIYNGSGSYSAETAQLTQGETYYIRAYAKNRDGLIGYSTEVVFETKEVFTVNVSASPTVGGTVTGGGRYVSGETCTVTATPSAGYRFEYWTMGNEMIFESTYSFTVTADVTLEALFTNRPIGTIDGRFTINGNGGKVWFSQGNLQYNQSTQVWSFMEHQYDMVETADQDVGNDYADQNIVSLFGWGTSGYHNNNDPHNEYYQPTCTSKEKPNYDDNYFGYGPSTSMPSTDLTGSSAHYDWGVHNQIMANGSNTTNNWRTLTKDEWDYLFNGRTGISYAKAQITGTSNGTVKGLILFPDNWNTSIYNPNNYNQLEVGFNSNSISVSQWNAIEAAGAVFLPAAGYRGGTTVNKVGESCHYWSVSFHSVSSAWCRTSLDSNSQSSQNRHNRCDGLTVRLVCPAR